MHWIDPDYLPEVEGTFERFILNPHGEVDGFVMKPDGRTVILVHTPPHLASELTRHLSPGDTVRVRGVRPRGADLVAAVAITSSGGRQIIDEGPEPDRKHPKLKHQPMAAEGNVRMSLFGPRGELRGALLSDGVVLRIGPKEAESVATLLAPGAKVAARGDGAETQHGRVIHVLEIGPGPHALKPVKTPKPKDKTKSHAEVRAA
ncbi:MULTISPECIES: hypothetical protein [unclassified Bradyrhizobium]|uniref:hypothetical protein n=1 Tax=unclassified Bradyrhizobium TaxID=2631580 RepID=UPI00247A770E|nr:MULTISPECIES: hypothetical protein [unclassified Bradyrhizobium]WGR74523.1 hypothetical protein MTX24_17550 [Bradyrhizobium sp. ISRA426]WGR79358.1 hypothetical protein MTX21_02665 [Bradyrhizobium sp. ISRA430]WGR89695.1 hypothetical protein MTX25_17230 [Bradyrhizobium sp. ISRA432]